MKPARIGIDARFYGLGQAGLARYTRELIAHLAQIETPHTFVVWLHQEDVPEWQYRQPNLELHTTSIRHYTMAEQILFARELATANLDLMHFTNFNFPVRYPGRFVVSIHDLTLLRYPGRSRLSKLKVQPMRLVIRTGIRRSTTVLTYSEFQKELMVKEFRADPDKIKVIHEAVDDKFKPLPAQTIAAFHERLGLKGPFVMYTGQWREHKNLARLIEAFSLVRRQMEAKLLLVGKIDPAFPYIPETIARYGLHDDVIMTDFVEDEELPYYYNLADIFAFPSLAEGFGLPPLEAMACGTTVAASRTSAMPEILGEAAVYFNPQDVHDIAGTLFKLLHDPKLRHEYRQRGLQQAARYSWQRAAKETYAVYEAALKPRLLP